MADQEIKDQYTEEQQVREKLKAIKKHKQLREDFDTKYRIKELLKEYKGDFEVTQNNSDVEIIPDNLIYAYVKTELPSLYIRDPHIKVNPKNRTTIQTAKVMEEAINYIWKYKKLKREIKKCIVEALLVGHSWVKLGYTGQFGSIEDEQGAYIDTIENEDIFAYHVNYSDIYFDNDAIDPPYDCKWIAHGVWLPTNELKKNPKYKNTENIPESYEEIDINRATTEEDRRRQGKTLIYEVWDLENKKVCTVTDGVDKYLEEKDWPLDMRGLPFSCLKFNFANDMADGLSDVAMFETQVLEQMKLESQALDHVKRYNRQLLSPPGNISDDEEAKLKRGITGSVIECEDPTKILPLPYPPVPSDAYALLERIKENRILISGQSPLEQGGSAKTSTRAVGELQMIQEGARNRRSEKIDLVEDFVEEIAGKLIALLKQFVQTPYYIRILGQDSPELQGAIQERASAQGPEAVTNPGGFTFTSEDIEGEYDLETVSGSSTPVDLVEENKTLFQFIELGPKAGAIPGGPFLAAVARKIVENTQNQELILAMEQEGQVQAQQKQIQAQKEEEMRTLALSQKAAETQLDAESVATKQNKVMVDFLNAQQKTQADKEKAERDIELEKIKAANDIEIEQRKAEAAMRLEAVKLEHEMKLEEIRLKHDLEIERLKTEAEILNMKKKEKAKPKKEEN